MSKLLKVYSDGGARGNPGPAAIAFVFLSEEGETMKVKSCYLGVRTNNQAEYEALIAALESARAFEPEDLVCYLDSELVTRQLTGEYSVKNEVLKKLWIEVQELKKCFKKVSFKNVPRTNEYIQRVDTLVNQTLDTVT
jgi:ribonuclease HI